MVASTEDENSCPENQSPENFAFIAFLGFKLFEPQKLCLRTKRQ